jgi:hypothetical protein
MPREETLEDNFERFSNKRFQTNLREEEYDEEEEIEIPNGFSVRYGIDPFFKTNWYWNNKIKNKNKQKTCGYVQIAKKKSLA